MIYQEILAKINDIERAETYKSYRQFIAISRAVVDLHKPQEITLPNGEWGYNCIHCDGYEYPCQTIQVIERELF